MSSPPRPGPLRVGVLAYPGVQLLDVAGPADVFSIAARERGQADGAYVVELIGLNSDLIHTSSGLRIAPDRALARCPGAPVHRLAQAGHFLQEDAPESIALLIRQFLHK